MTRRVVGILGGMGPEATILLQQQLLKKVEARDDADHLPLLIDMNTQVPSRIAHLIERGGENPGPVLADMAQRLETAGATALAMPCNTAHHYAPFITAAASIPFLDMVALSVAVARQSLPQGAKVGILASPAVKMASVFEEPFSEAGLSVIWPADLGKMLAAIKRIKANGPSQEALDILTDAATELTREAADVLLVACSEFSLMAEELVTHVPIVDTVDVLATAIHDHTTQEAS